MNDASMSLPSPIDGDVQSPIQCEACLSALRSPDRTTLRYLLTDQLTVPIHGCADHCDRFQTVCGYSTDADVKLLEHRPAGGITCPGCRQAHHSPEHPIVPLAGGAIGLLGCRSHETVVLEHFRTGLQTQQQLSMSLDVR